MHTRGLIAIAWLASGSLACSETPHVGVASETDNLTEARLADLVASDPTLQAIKEVAIADVEGFQLSFGDEIGVPEPSAGTGVSLASGYRVSGLDWFKTPNATYPNNKQWDQGSDTGKKCQWAAVFRFEAIFADPPAEAETMKAESMWSGAFWDWVDDYAATDRTGDPKATYAWSNGLWKWISASGAGDTCRTPTRSMVVALMNTCLAHANNNDGEPKGCRMPRRASVCQAIDADASACLDSESCEPPSLETRAALAGCCADGLADAGCRALEESEEPDQPQEPDPNSCADICSDDGRASGGCWCDAYCAASEDPSSLDCCDDYVAECR